MKLGKTIGVLAAMAVLLVMFLWMQGFLHHRIEPGLASAAVPPVPDGPRAVVERLDLEQVHTVVGTLSSRKTTLLSAKVPAHVREIRVRAGDRVQAGQILVVLDDADLRAKQAQAESGLASARANLANAESNFHRHRKLLEEGAVTRAAFDNAEAMHRMARAGVQEAENAVAELQVMLGYTQVTAPYGGMVVERLAEVGQLSAPGMPLLKIQDPDLIRLEAFVPESRRGRLEVGQQLPVRIDTVDRTLAGEVSEIVPSADPRSHSFLVRISLPLEPDIRAGMFARLVLPTSSRSVLVIPEEAVHYAGQLEMVWVVDGDRVRTRMVRVGRALDGRIEVLAGLKAGETVLLPATEQ